MRRALVAGCALAVFAGCAPRPGLELPVVGEWRQRFEVQRLARERVLAFALADLDVRAEGEAIGRLPRLELRAALAAPDRLRLRAGWLLGTAFDLVAEGDSVRAVVPARRLAVVVDPADAPIEAPARLVLRTLAATWEAPAAAWDEATTVSGVRHVRWLEGADTLTLAVASNGLPSRLAIRPAAGMAFDVHYDTWQTVTGVRCPAQMRLDEPSGRMRVRMSLDGIEPQREASRDWFALELPADARHVGWAQLGRIVRGSQEPW